MNCPTVNDCFALHANVNQNIVFNANNKFNSLTNDNFINELKKLRTELQIQILFKN